MKYLCICNHGNNRSGSMAKIIRKGNGPCLTVSPDYTREYVKDEAIAVGAHNFQDDSLKMLFEWADKIIDLSDDVLHIQEKFLEWGKEKYYRFNV